MYSPSKPEVKYRKDYRPSQFLIKNTKLIFQLFDSYTVVTSELTIERNPKDLNKELFPLILDGDELELEAIYLNDELLANDSYEVNADQLIVKDVAQSFVLKTQVRIYPNKNKSLEGLYTSNGKFCTQCEAEGFRKITYYLDRPEIMSEFHVRIEADQHQYPLLLSNGNPINQGQLPEDRHFVEWHDPFVKPSYLFALVAGDLDCLESDFTTMSGKPVKLKLYVDKGKLDQCQFAMDSLIASMRWDEEKFGREYDLDLYMIVAVSDFNMGAMENKGLNIFNTKYVLANKKTATDADFEGVERVIAHEYFHNWTGNRITCRDWFQLSLKEGLTVFRDQKFSEDMQSEAVQRIDQVKIIRAAQFAEDSGPMAHPIRPDSYIEMNNFYTVTVYNKGAEVIRMMHTLLGEQGFRQGMDLYFERHDGQAVTCEDFIKAMEDANQTDWTQFRNWYTQAGTPKLSVELKPIKPGRFELVCNQTCPSTPGQTEKAPFVLPIKIGFLNTQGLPANFATTDSEILEQEKLLVMTQTQQSFEIICNEDTIIPSLLRDFSAPVKLDFDYQKSDLATLFSADPNPFNRWDAGQKLISQILLSQSPNVLPDELNLLKEAFLAILNDENLDNALKALAVQIPDLSSLIGQSDKVDADALFEKHRNLKSSLAKELHDNWLNIHESMQSLTPGDRWLKNIALKYLMTCDAEKYFTLAENQLKNSDNMTDEIAAFQSISNTQHPQKPDAIQYFYEKWKNEELVMDKWFSTQAMFDHESTLTDVQKLIAHEKFSIENPNKVRAVISAFVAGNIAQFHSATGAGYEFLASMIIQLNAINPQIAAGLAKQFNQWKKFDVKRQALIQEQLERIKSLQNLSNDVFEVVDKSLKIK